MRFRVIVKAFALMCGVAAAIILWDTNHFVVRTYCVKSPKIKKKMRFVVLSDLHGKNFGKENQKLLAKIDELCPDGILIAGDMITAKPGKNYDDIIMFVRKLAKRYPVYYGSGNHEYRLEVYPEKYGDMSLRYEEGISHENLFRLRNDKKELVDANLIIAGLEIDREFYKKWKAPRMDGNYLKEKLGEAEGEKYSILIAHNPSYFPAYAEYGADLVVSGHVHGGIARIPFLGGVISPAFRLFPKYDGGQFKEKNSLMILDRGLGSHTIPVRFLNPGELVEICLEPEAKK